MFCIIKYTQTACQISLSVSLSPVYYCRFNVLWTSSAVCYSLCLHNNNGSGFRPGFQTKLSFIHASIHPFTCTSSMRSTTCLKIFSYRGPALFLHSTSTHSFSHFLSLSLFLTHINTHTMWKKANNEHKDPGPLETTRSRCFSVLACWTRSQAKDITDNLPSSEFHGDRSLLIKTQHEWQEEAHPPRPFQSRFDPSCPDATGWPVQKVQ